MLRSLAVVVCLIASVSLHSDVADAQSRSNTIANLIEQGRADSALAVATRRVGADSASVAAWFDLAEAQKANGKIESRRATLSHVLNMQPRDVHARLLLAADFFEANQYDSSAVFAHAALDFSNRSNAWAFYWLGRIHQATGQPDSALVYLKRARAVLPVGELF